MKFCITSPKANLALKHLRCQVVALVAAQLRSSPLTEMQLKWRDLAMAVLGKIRIVDQDEVKIVVH